MQGFTTVEPYLILSMNLRFVTAILLLISTSGNAQQKKVIVDASNNFPIEFANVLASKLQKGVISNQYGEIIWNITQIEKGDTITISHVSYESFYILFKDFEMSDTISLHKKLESLDEVMVKKDVDFSDYKNQHTLGYFQKRYDGGMYMRPGQQLGLRIINSENVKGILFEVKLNFDKLLPNASFRIRIKKNDNKDNFKDDLIPGGIVITPTKLRTKIDLLKFKIFIPENGFFVDIDYLGDGNNYMNWMDAPYIIYKKSHKYNESNTYTNYMDGYKWNQVNSILKNEQNPSNAQIQIKVLSK